MNAPKPSSELPGMPERPKPPKTSGGREIQNGAVSVSGGVAFELRTQAAIDYLAGFHEEDVVRLVVHGRVRTLGNSSQKVKDGTVLTRRAVIEVDYIDGAPNDEAVAVEAAIAATKADDAEPAEPAP